MRHSTLMNSLLAINGVLLAGTLWVQLSDRPLVASADASPQYTRQDPVQRGGVPNAGLQRLEMVRELRAIRELMEAQNTSIGALAKALDENFKVEVVNVDELRAAREPDDSEPPPPPVVRPARRGNGAGS